MFVNRNTLLVPELATPGRAPSPVSPIQLNREHPLADNLIVYFPMTGKSKTSLIHQEMVGNVEVVLPSASVLAPYQDADGPGFDFDATSDDEVVVSNCVHTEDIPQQFGMSIVWWMKLPSTILNWQSYCGKRGPGNDGGAWWIYTNNTGDLAYSKRASTASIIKQTVSSWLVAGGWAMYAFTCDGSSNHSGAHFYKNGVEATYDGGTTRNASGSFSSDAAEDFAFGGRGYATGDATAQMKNCMWFKGVLSQRQIWSLYNDPYQMLEAA